MQIFPDSTSDSLQGVSSSWYSWETTASDVESAFSSYLDSELDAAAREYEQQQGWFSTARSNTSNALQRAASEQTAQGSGSMLSLKVTEEDFAALEEDLLASGLSEDDIEELRQDVRSENGVTWKKLLDRIDDKLRAARNGSSSQDLSTDERRELMSLFAQLGFTPQQSEQLLTDIQGGRKDAAWVKISNALARMSPDTVLNVGKEQLAVLGKAMGLTDSFQTKLQTLFGGRQSLDLMPEELRDIVTQMRKEGLLAQRELLEENGDLRESLLRTMEEAKGRADMESLADNRESRDARASRELIKDAAEERFGRQRARSDEQDRIGDKRTRADADESGWDRRSRMDNQRRSAVQEDPDSALRSRLAKDADRTAEEKQAALFGNDRTAKYRAGQDSESGLEQKNADQSDPWEEIAKRIAFRTENAAASAMSRQAAAAEAAEIKAQAAETEATPLQQRVMDTIQDAILRNTGQGRNQIVLRLDPPSLGKVSVILQVHNKEVTALIKTENHDVTNMVSEQLDNIRQQLEQQGLKVQRLDVQTQLNQDQASHWLGAEQHNLGRDQETQQSLMSAWKRLLTDSSDQIDASEAGVQETMSGPGASSGLHIIA